MPPGSAIVGTSEREVTVMLEVDAARKCTVCIRTLGPDTYPFSAPGVRIGREQIDFQAFWRRTVNPLKARLRLPQPCLCLCCTQCILTVDVWKPMYGVSNITWDVLRRLRFQTQLVEAVLARAVFREKVGFVPDQLCTLILDLDLL